ncbi:MAG: hypothetical protein HY425_01080 [Candidatus Levybacteria bacterium]|nr:hypothetical protein [Candidatus Levybacteria bacterium]
MKEAEKIIKADLTKMPNPPYARGGEIFMEGKPDMTPAKDQQPSAKTMQDAVEKLLQQPGLNVGVRGALEQFLKQGGVPFSGGAPEPGEPTAQAGGTGQGSGEGNPPPTSGSPPEEPNEQERALTIKDVRAANLIGKFKQEHGENDPKKIQQLRGDLSRRIQELEKEQDELGAREGARITEGERKGELTTEAAATIDEISNRIGEIQEVLAGIFPNQEGGRRGDPLVAKLNKESEEFVRGLLGRGLKISEINDLAKLTPGEKAKRRELVHDIKEFIEGQPSIETSSFNSDILLAVRHFKELREELISDILFKSFQDSSETNEYEVGLYAASNLDILLGFMSKDDNERYKKLFTLRTATRFFQTMNSTVIKGTFDSFGHSAENINYEHFENMRDIRGSGLAMRLFEQAYKDVLADDKKVTQDKVAGIKTFVEKTFKEMNEAGLIKSEFAPYRENSRMEDWEIKRALAAGRTFFNITLRAAENIATGQVPTDRKRYTSPPQEDMVRILNWNQWLLARFTVGGGKEGRHGEEFLKMTTDRYQDFLRYKGAKLDKNKITEFGGVDVRKMEDGSQYRTSGVYSGWRLENMAFNEIYFNYEGRRLSVQEFRDGVKDRVDAVKNRIEERKKVNPNMDPKDLITEEDQREYRDILMPVVNNLNFGLSMLIKNGDFGTQDNKLGYLLRTEIWRKIAKTNTPLLIDYLMDIKYASDIPDAEKAKSIAVLRNKLVPEWSDEQWEIFRTKALIGFERIIGEGMGEKLTPIVQEYELSADEKKLEDAIKEEGEKLAPHLADIIFPYTPFMNDMPFEELQYKYTGQTFYKRRTTGDLGGFNKGQNAYTKILDNAGGIPTKEAIEAMGEIVAGIAGPEGPRPAMEANFPTFSALLDVVVADPGKRQAMVKILLEATRKETSLAQRWAGIKAESFIESEAANLIDDASRAGILNPELARYLKKNKHLTLSAILWMLIRDVFIMAPVFVGVEVVSKVTKDK